MKNWPSLFLRSITTLTACGMVAWHLEGAPVNVILDTDIGPDPGDVAAVALLHGLADRGEINILATVNCTGSEWGPLALNALNSYYGRPELPVGTLKDRGYLADRTFINRPIARRYTRTVKTADEIPAAAALYRQVLARQPDHSVKIIAIGPLRAVHQLLKSEPDQSSPLNGRELVAKKVIDLSCMGGWYPKSQQDRGPEWNFEQDSEASRAVAETWPTPILFSDADIGYGIMTGRRHATDGPEYDPVTLAITLFPDTGFGQDRPSWDQLSILYAARGLSNYWTATASGYNRVEAKGANTFTVTEDRGHRYLQKLMPVSEIEDVMEDLMVGAKEGAHDFYFDIATYAPDGMGTVTAQDEQLPQGARRNAFDRDGRNAWIAGSSNSWIQYQSPDGKKYAVAKYAVTPGENPSETAPRRWTLAGSNNGADWITLDTRTDETFTNRNDRREFVIAKPSSFNAYRLSFTGARPVQVGGVELLEHIHNVAGVKVTGVELDQSQIQVPVVGRAALNVTVLPLNALNKQVTWTSSNPSVARVKRIGKNTAIISGLAPGTSRVTATTSDGQKVAASAVAVTPATLPVGWTYEEVNSPAVPGAANFSNGAFTVTGGGEAIARWWQRIWDQFAFVNQPAEGDGTLTARIAALDKTQRRAAAGLMFRETLARDSRFVMLGVNASRELYLTWRDGPQDEGPRRNLGKFDLPLHLKLERRGDTFYAYASTNGVTWGEPLGQHAGKQFGPVLKAGLAVCAHNNPTTTVAQFDQVTLEK